MIISHGIRRIRNSHRCCTMDVDRQELKICTNGLVLVDWIQPCRRSSRASECLGSNAVWVTHLVGGSYLGACLPRNSWSMFTVTTGGKPRRAASVDVVKNCCHVSHVQSRPIKSRSSERPLHSVLFLSLSLSSRPVPLVLLELFIPLSFRSFCLVYFGGYLLCSARRVSFQVI